MALFKRHRVYNLTELAARCEALLDNYCKTLHIEAKTMLSMVRQEILPAVSAFGAKLAAAAAAKRAFDPGLSCAYEADRAERLCRLTDEIDAQARELEQIAAEAAGIPSAALQAEALRDRLHPAMARLRAACDQAETLLPAADWPLPAYSELLFSV